jgi:hypothetical protein
MRSRRHLGATLLLLLAALVLSAALAGTAAALPTFTQAVGGIGPCDSCHTQAATHAVAAHQSFFATCSTCHASGTATPPLPAACAACHGGTATILTAHPSKGCATTVGCHGVVVAVPTVTGFTPSSGIVGTKVTLTGTGFPGATAVTFNGVAAATFTIDTPTSLIVTVPSGATTGPIAVTTAAGTGTSALTFTVTMAKPKISKLSPTAGKRGAKVVISGSAFGATRGKSVVKFGSVKVSKYLSWKDAKLTVRVPPKAKFGTVKVKVTTAAGTSNAKSFKVKH